MDVKKLLSSVLGPSHSFSIIDSATRLGDLLDFKQLFNAFGNT